MEKIWNGLGIFQIKSQMAQLPAAKRWTESLCKCAMEWVAQEASSPELSGWERAAGICGLKGCSPWGSREPFSLEASSRTH